MKSKMGDGPVMKIESILKQIEQKRQEMHELAEQNGLSDFRVLAKSHELDRLLNRYQCNENRPFCYRAG